MKDPTLYDDSMMTFEDAHQILRDIGLTVESRNWLKVNGQLLKIAAIVVNNGGLGEIDEKTINELAQKNRLMDVAITVEKRRLLREKKREELGAKGAGRTKSSVEATLCQEHRELSNLKDNTTTESDKVYLSNPKNILFEKAHLILKDTGLDSESRNCIARNQLIDIALFVEKHRGFGELDEDTINKLVKRRANYLLDSTQIDKNTINNSLADKDKTIATKTKKTLKAERDNLIKDIYVMYLSALRRSRKTVSLKKGKRHTKRCRKPSKGDTLLLKGKYIRLIISHCNYLFTLNQLCDMSKKLQMTPKDIEKLCDKRIIYRQEQNGTYLYAENKSNFKQNWNSQIEYFNKLFNRPGFTKTKCLISSLIKKTLLEKKWFLDEIYVSILISKVLQIPANPRENMTMKKRKNESDQKDKSCQHLET